MSCVYTVDTETAGVRTEFDGSLESALDYAVEQQREDGSWEGEMVWCPMITAQYVITRRILGREFDDATRDAIIRYFEAVRTKDTDGSVGWGLHPESHPFVFVTALVYVALRLLGLPPSHPLLRASREWLLKGDGVESIPTWGKFWLSLIGVYDYDGLNSVPPWLFLLPRWLPVHPDKLYSHTRYIYLGIAYLFGRRFSRELPESSDLRCELYSRPYHEIDFSACRHLLAASDVYVKPGRWLRRGFDLIRLLDRMCPPALRRRAIARCARRIEYEQRATRYCALSPVSGLLNTMALADLGRKELEPSLQGLEHWRWQDKSQGIRLAGARTKVWDTAFTMQAVLEYAPAVKRHRESLRRAYRYLRDAQIVEELDGGVEQSRDSILGGWCISDGWHGWPISDCTAEALSAILAAHKVPGLIPASARIPDAALISAARFILSRQNAEGGFGSYERRRAGRFLERFNPSEMFSQCMTEQSYVECTASAVKALCRFEQYLPGRLATRKAVARAVAFLRSRQRADGSFAGFWGINFIYAGLFVTEALHDFEKPHHDSVCERIARWLIAHQKADGGWGEHHSSCLEGAYREHPASQAVMTAWAVLALLVSSGPESKPVQNGIGWLRARQCADGSFPNEAVNGAFFGSAMLDYRLYRIYFPLWALARYAQLLEAK